MFLKENATPIVEMNTGEAFCMADATPEEGGKIAEDGGTSGSPESRSSCVI